MSNCEQRIAHNAFYEPNDIGIIDRLLHRLVSGKIRSASLVITFEVHYCYYVSFNGAFNTSLLRELSEFISSITTTDLSLLPELTFSLAKTAFNNDYCIFSLKLQSVGLSEHNRR